MKYAIKAFLDNWDFYYIGEAVEGRPDVGAFSSDVRDAILFDDKDDALDELKWFAQVDRPYKIVEVKASEV